MCWCLFYFIIYLQFMLKKQELQDFIYLNMEVLKSKTEITIKINWYIVYLEKEEYAMYCKIFKEWEVIWDYCINCKNFYDEDFKHKTIANYIYQVVK